MPLAEASLSPRKRRHRAWALLLILAGLGLLLAAPALRAQAQAPDPVPSYYQDVLPILWARCMDCHHAEGIAPMALDEAAFAQENAQAIAQAVRSGSMPPWMPSEAMPPLRGERKLSPAEIALISDWARGDAPLGDASNSPPPPTPSPAPLREDLRLAWSAPYLPDASLGDDYRCFPLNPGLSEMRFITGQHIRPGQSGIVHHVLLFHIPARALRAMERTDLRDPGPGWQCFGDTGIDSASIIGTWTPGEMPLQYPAGTGFQLLPGDHLVMQVHYFLGVHGALPDQTQVILQLDAPPLTALRVEQIFAPVELPCPAGSADSPACTREAAIAAAARLNPDAERMANGLLMSCGRSPLDLSEYSRQDASAIRSSCDLVMSRDVRVLQIIGHMHTRGSSINVTASPDSPAAQVLLDIPAWDFHWQSSYQYLEPPLLRQGERLRLTCTWDNSQDAEPRYIIWGDSTEDEMCLAFLTVMPAR